MDIIWIVLSVLLMITGIAGCILPFLPGPPLCYLALLALQLTQAPPFTARFLWIWAGITLFVVALEYAIPLLGTKKFGGTSYGVWGCTIGLIAGIWLGPLGIILGPFVGAFLGEIIGNSDIPQAFRAAWGSFIGFLVGTFLKLAACLVMAFYLVKSML